MQGGTKCHQGLDNSLCILQIGAHPEIEVFRGSDMTMRSQRVSANYKELNLAGVEFG
jgi:hypothetical protein